MTREKWISIGVDRALVDHIDSAVGTLKVFGKPKYNSRQAFVAEAIQTQLRKEFLRREGGRNQIQSQNQDYNGEQEVIAR
jgi:hypothetical protein